MKAGIKVGIITDGRPEGQRNKLESLGLDVDDVIIMDELGGVQFPSRVISLFGYSLHVGD